MWIEWKVFTEYKTKKLELQVNRDGRMVQHQIGEEKVDEFLLLFLGKNTTLVMKKEMEVPPSGNALYGKLELSFKMLQSNLGCVKGQIVHRKGELDIRRDERPGH